MSSLCDSVDVSTDAAAMATHIGIKLTFHIVRIGTSTLITM